jgi:lysophospholipase L1-like esterase
MLVDRSLGRLTLICTLMLVVLWPVGCGVSSPAITPIISWSPPAPITYGTALSSTQLDASAGVPGRFSYSPASGTALSAGSHSLSATFTPDDTKDYLTTSASVTLTVGPAVPVITWPIPAPIVYGTPLSTTQLDATANIPGTFTYSPSAGSLLEVGAATLSAAFTPTDAVDYSPATAQAILQVEKVTPLLHWSPPDPIAMNTPLTADRLNVTASDPLTLSPLAGTFVFSPPAGTQFTSPVPQELKANFTPADTNVYASAQASNTLLVLPQGVVCWGDSLTGKLRPDGYPGILGTLISLPVVSEAVGGQTSTEIGVRQGGVHTNVTVKGGTIPADASVGVTFPQGYQPVTSLGPAEGVSGSIAGVHGLITLSDQGLIFTRGQAGEAIAVPQPVPFLVDKPDALYLPIFWEGHNSLRFTSPVLSDLAAQVASLADGQDYVVLAVINADIEQEWKGEPGYQWIQTLNQQLANIYGSHFIDVRADLVNAYNAASIVDVSDFNHDEVPTSLRKVKGWGTLANAIDAAATSITLNLTVGSLKAGNILTIDTGSNAENVEVFSFSGSTVTVIRHTGGVAAPHAAGAPVVLVDQLHLSAQGYGLVARDVAAYLDDHGISAAKTGRSAKNRAR